MPIGNQLIDLFSDASRILAGGDSGMQRPTPERALVLGQRGRDVSRALLEVFAMRWLGETCVDDPLGRGSISPPLSSHAGPRGHLHAAGVCAADHQGLVISSLASVLGTTRTPSPPIRLGARRHQFELSCRDARAIASKEDKVPVLRVRIAAAVQLNTGFDTASHWGS